VLTYSAGDYIYTAGQPVEGLYVVLSGEAAEGFLVGAFFGEPEHISSEGELLGYTDFTGDRYLYSAKALTDNTKVCMFDKASILDTCRTNKNFSFQLLRFYQDTLKEQEARQFARIEKGNL
jgi:CRP-like cAMP-binding protein